jgi:asparagine synthase (glutamine-hydrolysing)
MCGIAGILRFDGAPVSRDRMAEMTDAIAHRGRDSAGFAIGGEGRISCRSLALGHRRLSIIDLSAAAVQPMFSADRRLCMVYNGELYNYRQLREELKRSGAQFHTQSDTEVILAAYAHWGRDCLDRFNGMFAFAIWDEVRQRLFCARDALGVKPFYYRLDADAFEFSSESRTLGRGTLDEQAVAAYFFSMYVPRELSIHAGVRKLLPGCWLEVAPDGKHNIQKWWRMPKMVVSDAGADEAAVRLQQAIDKAVVLQLQSDVPVGALLSGGFDSGMVLASAAHQVTHLHTYSIGFDDPQQFNELPIASALAQRYGSNHHAFTLTSKDALDVLDRALVVMSEPVADSAVVPTWFLAQQAAADGVKVLLSGTGGDEVFGGYSRYVASSWRRRLIYSLPDAARRAFAQIMPDGIWAARMRHASLDMAIYTGGSSRLAARLIRAPGGVARFLDGLANEIYPPSESWAPLLYRNMAFDLQVYLPDLLLMLLDQLCMAHTVEGRVPLLDVDLIAQSYALASELHANPSQPTPRRLMRKMAQGRVDPRTFTAPKQGFSGPVRAWVANHEEVFRERTLSLAAISGLETLRPEDWWRVPKAKRDALWAHEIFLMYAFATWHRANVHG